MSRLIDADKLPIGKDYMLMVEDIIYAPTVDAVPVVRCATTESTWFERRKGVDIVEHPLRCNKCGMPSCHPKEVMEWNFCPFCARPIDKSKNVLSR